MKKRAAIIFMGVLLAAVCVMAAWRYFTKPPEPVYAGRTLTEWLMLPHGKNAVPGDEAASSAAIRAMGTNAVPFLMGWLTNRDNVARKTVYSLLERFRPEEMSLSEGTKRYLSYRLIELNEADFEQAALPQLNALTNSPDLNIQAQAKHMLRSYAWAKAFRHARQYHERTLILDGELRKLDANGKLLANKRPVFDRKTGILTWVPYDPEATNQPEELEKQNAILTQKPNGRLRMSADGRYVDVNRHPTTNTVSTTNEPPERSGNELVPLQPTTNSNIYRIYQRP
ncbi:MAG: repeat protein [Pedosphaera sp.]|nr:repeat protein [Pedosphaera sp.]